MSPLTNRYTSIARLESEISFVHPAEGSAYGHQLSAGDFGHSVQSPSENDNVASGGMLSHESRQAQQNRSRLMVSYRLPIEVCFLSATERRYTNQRFMMLFGLITGSIMTLAGVVGLFVRPNPALGILGIIFGLCFLTLGIQKISESQLQVKFDKPYDVQEDEHPF